MAISERHRPFRGTRLSLRFIRTLLQQHGTRETVAALNMPGPSHSSAIRADGCYRKEPIRRAWAEAELGANSRPATSSFDLRMSLIASAMFLIASARADQCNRRWRIPRKRHPLTPALSPFRGKGEKRRDGGHGIKSRVRSPEAPRMSSPPTRTLLFGLGSR